VDPLDGTTNYVHDCPAYCVSIGLEVAGELAVGVIYDPRLDELYTAVKGQGAALNGRPLRTSPTDRLDDALLATGFPPDLRGQERQLDWWRYFSLRARSLRRTGSTALNLAYVAAGRFDGYWAFDNNAWDVAGGVLLIREAGGRVTAIDGGPYSHHDRPVLASNGSLHPALLACLSAGPEEPHDELL
jgi:myo-inositol-1(or 4)-monophosphatase